MLIEPFGVTKDGQYGLILSQPQYRVRQVDCQIIVIE